MTGLFATRLVKVLSANMGFVRRSYILRRGPSVGVFPFLVIDERGRG